VGARRERQEEQSGARKNDGGEKTLGEKQEGTGKAKKGSGRKTAGGGGEANKEGGGRRG
jgi:hypothetical protein